ncbi:uncharacterized protein LOC121588184 [Anopheles merus]|uniref:uncharacterized protein LOC121588184 n=1 Tax=Anopheles merus TaxID=30066 RepID=UPI001BE4D643|nr:uncharacterized protein LOC121588184 [Anopheles merus]
MASKQLVLDHLKSFIEESESRINRILQSVGWSKESLLNSNVTKTTDEHSQDKNQSNNTDTLPASFQPSDSRSSIRLDNIKQAEAILEEVYRNPSFELGVPFENLVDRDPPSSIADLHVNFTREERLSICQHVLANTTKPPDVPEIKIRFKQDTHSEEKPTSLPEIAAIVRDARRRNPKHRVSRNPLTYSEELRHVIQVQTDALAHHFRQTSRTAVVDAREGRRRESKHVRKSRSKSPLLDRNDRSRKNETNYVRRSRSNSPAPGRSYRKRNRHRSRSRDRSRSNERKRHKSEKKHKKKRDR